jgi:hypothetical protein
MNLIPGGFVDPPLPHNNTNFRGLVNPYPTHPVIPPPYYLGGLENPVPLHPNLNPSNIYSNPINVSYNMSSQLPSNQTSQPLMSPVFNNPPYANSAGMYHPQLPLSMGPQLQINQNSRSFLNNSVFYSSNIVVEIQILFL